ncbi:DNA topoisomerase IB [Nocardia tenerifensis]|uniref:DNA topoisomerase n=1 Tax=Nocardia tenerifensis TaxID=228006 RepID=A0A318JTW6_9NOCA|nr:DNA topoisomerase IB [Nocardia tenerifensis]PXX57464.1 DNA topoisomerase IB [Nocardia tenerifensis]
MRLRRSTVYGPGLTRVRRGKGFSYTTIDGEAVTDEETLDRIKSLVIPPAWRKVWICPHHNGHVQAVGIDAAGRRQYLYHEQWRRERDEEKFDRVLELAARLPEVRQQVRHDLSERGFTRHRAEAVAIELLDRGVFRVGGEEYAEENGTRGVATLLREQVRLSGDEMHFDYPAKGGIRRRVCIREPLLAKTIRALRRCDSGSPRLLVYRNGSGYRELHADDVNLRFKELACCECSAKDLRTWQATVLAAADFASTERPTTKTGRKAAVKKVMTDVAAALGNTPTVARNSYVDPRVVTAFEEGSTIAPALRRARQADSDDASRELVDKAVIRLLKQTK